MLFCCIIRSTHVCFTVVICRHWCVLGFYLFAYIWFVNCFTGMGITAIPVNSLLFTNGIHYSIVVFFCFTVILPWQQYYGINNIFSHITSLSYVYFIHNYLFLYSHALINSIKITCYTLNFCLEFCQILKNNIAQKGFFTPCD